MKVMPRSKPSSSAKTISRLTAGIFFNDAILARFSPRGIFFRPEPDRHCPRGYKTLFLRTRFGITGPKFRHGNIATHGGPLSIFGLATVSKKRLTRYPIFSTNQEVQGVVSDEARRVRGALLHLIRQENRMIVYKVFYKDYDNRKGVLLGKLTERRSDLRGLSAIQSGLKWAVATFGDQVRDKGRLFVVPEEVQQNT
jgi:hypothetical protein